jgi:CMP-N-acetylneuraminic acid synthetase
VLSVEEDRGHYWIEKDGKHERLYPKDPKNRQFEKPLLKENGAIYVYTRDILMKEGKINSGKMSLLIMQKEESIDIDEPIDFEIAEFFMRGRENEKN